MKSAILHNYATHIFYRGGYVWCYECLSSSPLLPFYPSPYLSPYLSPLPPLHLRNAIEIFSEAERLDPMRFDSSADVAISLYVNGDIESGAVNVISVFVLSPVSPLSSSLASPLFSPLLSSLSHLSSPLFSSLIHDQRI